tara:strand:- start:326 stop:490 length:165 start_codon:yes stop_codon:yes gene_type:complete
MIKFIISGAILTSLTTGAFVSGILIGANKKKITDKIKKITLKRNNSASTNKNLN